VSIILKVEVVLRLMPDKKSRENVAETVITRHQGRGLRPLPAMASMPPTLSRHARVRDNANSAR